MSAKTVRELAKVLVPRKKGQSTTAILGGGVVCEMDAEGAYVLPATAAECADLLYRSRERRLAMQRETERVERLEKQLQAWFIDTLPASQTGVAGRVARVQVEAKAVPQVEDWDKFYAYVAKNKAFELLQRRLNEGAAKERLDAGQGARAGITVFHAKKVSCVKL
jgi:hypothetical protein